MPHESEDIIPKEKANEKKIIQVPTHSDPKLWFKVYCLRKELLRVILKPVQSVSILCKLHDDYVYALCRVSQQKGIVSNILSKYLQSRLSKVRNINQLNNRDLQLANIDNKNQSEPSKPKGSQIENNRSKTMHITTHLYDLLKKRKEAYASTRGVIAKYISDIISRKFKRFESQYEKDRYHYNLRPPN